MRYWLKHHGIDVLIYGAIIILGLSGAVMFGLLPKYLFETTLVYGRF